MVIAVASLVGTPTAGALLRETDEAHFRRLIVFCGVLSVAGTLVLALAGVAGSGPGSWKLWRRRGPAGEGMLAGEEEAEGKKD